MFWGTLVRYQHRTQRSIFSHLALLARERRFLFLSKLIILFAMCKPHFSIGVGAGEGVAISSRLQNTVTRVLPPLVQV